MENLSPVVERRSRRIGPVDNSTEEVPVEELNDDEEERSRYRQQLENDAKNQSSNEKRFSASEKTLSEHFQSCIQLAAENKINAKNAFSFKLIDLLHMMLSKKKQIPDFTEVTCSLDAGVKIYSYRVDNVHSDTMKMATSICSGANKNRDEHNDMPEEPSEDSPTKKKKHSKKRIKCVLENRESINRNNAEERFGIPPPFLTTEKWITDTAIFDNAGICIHVNQSLSFRESCFKVKIENCSTKRVPVEIADIQDELLCPTFDGIFLKEETEETDCDEVSLKDKIAHQYNYEHTILENTAYENTMDDNAAADDFFEDAATAPEAEEIHQTVFCRSADAIPHSALFSTDISHLISSETLDYRYFNTQVMQNKWSLKSAGYWNPKKNKETISKPRSQKKELIDFENFNDFSAFEDEAKIPLTIVTSSSRDKFLITPVTHFNFKEFFRLKTCRGMFVVPTMSNEEQPSDLEETIKDYDYNNPNDSQHLIPEQYEDDYVDEDHDGVAGDVHEVIENGILQGDNLVEIPNKVAKIELPYMVKDKFVDMKKLKSEIWEKIDLNEKLNTQENENVQELEFSHICREIISNSKADLSVPILFNAILQLANDRNLEFAYTEQNSSNFFIRVNEGKSN